MAALLDALQWIADFFAGASDYIVTLIKNAVVWILAKGFIAWVEAKIWLVGLAWDVAKQVLQDLQIGDQVAAYYAVLPDAIRQAANFFGIPTAVNLIANAGVTKMVLRFLNS